jgi:hypothetical protein
VTAPAPPEPDARSEVISAVAAARTEQAIGADPPSHSLPALLRAEQGLDGDAALAVPNPASPLIASLRPGSTTAISRPPLHNTPQSMSQAH